MQQKENHSLYEWLQKLHIQINFLQTISSSKSKQYLQLIKKQIILNNKLHLIQDSLYLTLKIIYLIQQKTYNLSQKITSQVWKIFLVVAVKLDECLEVGKEGICWDFENQGYLTAAAIYKKILKGQQKRNRICQQQFNEIRDTYENLYGSLWTNTFKYTNLKSLEPAFLTLYLGWDIIFHISPAQKQPTSQPSSLQYLQKCCMYLIKFSQRIKQSQTFQNLIQLLKKIKQKFQLTFKKQIQTSIKSLKQKFKLTQTINFFNPYQNVWQKIILSTVVCMSKRFSNKQGQIFTLIELFTTLQQTLLIERLINLCRNYRYDKKKQKRLFVIPAQQLQYVLFCTMINICVNLKIMKQSLKENQKQMGKQSDQENKQEKQLIKKKSENIDRVKKYAFELIEILIKREISVMMVRQLIKKLQIVNLSYPVQQWKQIFSIMSLLLKQYPTNRSLIQLQDDNSYISKKFSSPLKYPFTIHLKLKGESIPFKQQKILIQFIDSSSKQKIWITMRNYQKNTVIFSYMKLKKNDDIEEKIQKQFIKWNQYEANSIEIVLKSDRIKIFINNDDSVYLYMQAPKSTLNNTLNEALNNNNKAKSTPVLKKIDQIVLCDRESNMGSTISQLYHFKLIQYKIFEQQQKTQIDFVQYIDCRSLPQSSNSKNINNIKQNLTFFKCQKVNQYSFIYYNQALGDLQLFMLILYHILKKIKNQSQLLEMIRGILKLMEEFTVYKDVQVKQLTQEEKDTRRNTILCLCWFYAKQTKSVIIILELMRFLYIRGKRDNQQLLKFLCNLSYWREFKLQNQLLILMKIRQLLKQSSKQQQKISNLKFCKKILFDMVLFLKQSHYLLQQKQTCLKLHKIVFQTVYQLLKDIIQFNNKKQKYFMLEIFYFLQFLINLISSILNRKISEDTFDITFAIELTLFLRDIAKLIFVSKQRKHISKGDIDIALELYFKKQQKDLVLPLGLNLQDTCDQRFNLFLSRIMSQTKSLIILFQTQTFYIQQNQIKIYPIYSQHPISCSQNKVYSNVISFNIYLSMLSQKSWNYILFGMPLSEYNERFCQSLWRICFFQLSKEKRYYNKITKMLQQTPLPQNDYCLMKIFQAVLFNNIYEKQHMYRLLSSSNFYKSICPFKLQNLLIKFINKLQPQVIDTTDQTQFSLIQSDLIKQQTRKQKDEYYQQQKIYYVLFHNKNGQYPNTKQVIECLKYRKMYQFYKIVVYHVVLKSLVNVSKGSGGKEGFWDTKMSENTTSSNDINNKLFQSSTIMAFDNNQNTLNNNNTSVSTIFSINHELQTLSRTNTGKTQTSLLSQLPYLKSDFLFLSLEALSFYKNSLTSANIKQFLNLNTEQEISAHTQNLIIQVEGIIKGLNIIKACKQTKQFDKYSSFIDVHLKQYSQFLIFKKFPSFKPLKTIQRQNVDSINQESVKKPSSRSKYLFKTLYVDLVKNSTDFFLENMAQRRQELHNLEQIWNEVQKKNKFFWNLFISNEKYYSLSDITTDLGERLLLTISNDRPKIQLPKMISKQSLLNSISMISDKNEIHDESQSSALYQQSDIFRPDFQQIIQNKNKQKTRKGSSNINTKQIKTKKYRVFLITNNKIYQGLLYMSQKFLIKFQQTYPNEQAYDKIYANPKQRRQDEEIQRQPKNIDILVNYNSTKIFHRKYLFYDVGLEIYTYEKNYFFCFDAPQKRNKFCSFYFKDCPNIITYQKARKLILQQSKKWSSGLLSNYEYLLKINQYSNRSLNDMSQYYIMPWTIIQFQKKQINKSYIFQSDNFRDLRKPLGKIFDKKWKDIEMRFKNSYGHLLVANGNNVGIGNSSSIGSCFTLRKEENTYGCGMEPFMYGSFYSNPAIVTNYMIRLEPFSSMHFHLQSQKIDIADRLFFQFSDQYRSIKTNTSDVKELIPEFYNNPEFLKNKSRLNLGSRQNKQIVNDVRLPKWADTAIEFVFKMKYFLESPLVSKYLNHWIDLTFGINAKRQNAFTADNLYMSQIYGPQQSMITQKIKQKLRQSNQPKSPTKRKHMQSKLSSILSTDTRVPINKQFGQLPLILFQTPHPQFQMNQDFFFFKGHIQHILSIQSSSSNQKIQPITSLQIKESFSLVMVGRTLQMFQTSSGNSLLDLNTSSNNKENWKSIASFCDMQILFTPQIISGSKLSSLLPYLFYIKRDKKKLYSRYIKKTKIFGSLELRDQFQVCDANVYNFLGDEVLVVGLGNSLKVSSFQECAIKYQSSSHQSQTKRSPTAPNSSKISMLKIQQNKPALALKQFPVFTQHRAQITLISVNQDLNIILSLDQMNKIFLLKYYPDKLQVINNFEIKNLNFEEKIVKVILHKMSMIICLTSYNRIVSYNFYGQLIGAKQVGFKRAKKTQQSNPPQRESKSFAKSYYNTLPIQQHLTCLTLFNKQTSQLLIGTNFGNIWKIDLFEFYKTQQQIQPKQLWFDKISLNTKQNQYVIKNIDVKTYGRHWELYVLSYDQNKRKIVSKIKCMTLKNIIFNLNK